jgi:membrane-associated phospholipid phosphatase
MRRLRPWLFGLITSVVLLAAVRALAFAQPQVRRLDAEAVVSLSERRWASSRGALAAIFVHLGDPFVVLFLVAAICGLAVWRGLSSEALAAASLIFGAGLTTQLLKHSVSPPRLQPLLGIDQIGETSFPSGHTTAVAALGLALVLVVPRRLRPAAVLLTVVATLAMGLSVVIRHWHFPSDAIGGALVATAWFCAVNCAIAAPPIETRQEPGPDR